jgi:2-polyprenyl-6-methoxyphenol hydroxylase-like FAD-dependent oxidoreductase
VLAGQEDDLKSIGIRRWRLQKVLLQAVEEAGIKIHFAKRLERVKQVDEQVQLQFADGTSRACKLLLAADGSNSQVRKIITRNQSTLKYTGTQCLMGTSALARAKRGLCLPSSPTTK